jgi:hypothetical protein
MQIITQEKFIKELEDEVAKLYKVREKAGTTPEGKKFEAEMFGQQLGLLYVIDYLRNVYKLV